MCKAVTVEVVRTPAESVMMSDLMKLRGTVTACCYMVTVLCMSTAYYLHCRQVCTVCDYPLLESAVLQKL